MRILDHGATCLVWTGSLCMIRSIPRDKLPRTPEGVLRADFQQTSLARTHPLHFAADLPFHQALEAKIPETASSTAPPTFAASGKERTSRQAKVISPGMSGGGSSDEERFRADTRTSLLSHLKRPLMHVLQPLSPFDQRPPHSRPPKPWPKTAS